MPGHGRDILVVDDDADIREVVESILRSDGGTPEEEDAGVPGATPPSDESGGCGCHLGSRSGAPLSALFAALLLLARAWHRHHED